MKLLLGNCLDKLKELKDNSVDSIVTDPPYGLSFMGKKWDYDVPSQEIWEECLRVLKPGGHLLAFAGSRTYHRMAVRIEDAGFEIRDQIMWVYGSGFPKSMNIGIQIDKKLGNKREVVSEKVRGDVEKAKQNGTGYLADPANRNNTKQFGYGTQTITKGNTEWEGWGTALKPAHEPIVMARKPFKGTVVDNVLEWGTGGINIDDSRIGTDDNLNGGAYAKNPTERETMWGEDAKNSWKRGGAGEFEQPKGRFPANIIFDEEAGKILDEQSENASRFFYCPKASKKDRNEGLDEFEDKVGGSMLGTKNGSLLTSSGNVRNNKLKNHHPTVKPTDLMVYLIRLVTPKNGTTLDPFMGSGSTGKAAVRGGFDFIGIEREEEYYNIANTRIIYESKKIESLLFNPQNPGSVQ
jgi:DNA modification methylase